MELLARPSDSAMCSFSPGGGCFYSRSPSGMISGSGLYGFGLADILSGLARQGVEIGKKAAKEKGEQFAKESLVKAAEAVRDRAVSRIRGKGAPTRAEMARNAALNEAAQGPVGNALPNPFETSLEEGKITGMTSVMGAHKRGSGVAAQSKKAASERASVNRRQTAQLRRDQAGLEEARAALRGSGRSGSGLHLF